MTIRIKAFSNCDDACIIWKPDAAIPGCLGFALYRDVRDKNGHIESDIVPTFVGFKGDPKPAHGCNPSTVWPIQRYIWTDYLAFPGQWVRYRVAPMTGQKGQLQAQDAQGSAWTEWLLVGTAKDRPISAFFNRGIVASQWISRAMKDIPREDWKRSLTAIINDPTSKVRARMGGEVRYQLLRQLQYAATHDETIYACLFELEDPELIPALSALEGRANLILANGAVEYKKTPEGQPAPAQKELVDKNAEAREHLKAEGRIHLYDRLVKPGHLSHNKFVVFCDAAGTPRRVWTGSTNWTVTGLCTQANNAVLIADDQIALWFKEQWDLLKDCGDAFPPKLKNTNSVTRRRNVGGSDVSVWFTPQAKQAEMEQVRDLIRSAEQGILFLMFNPGPRGTLLNAIIEQLDSGLFIHGVVNQDPGGNKNPVLRLYDRGEKITAKPDVLVPAAIGDALEYWQPEMKQYSLAMVHSKVIVIDPFGPHPVVVTGSHNLGPKASRANDDNLLVIEHAPEVAAEYAVNILAIYGQYKWRHNVTTRHVEQKWNSLSEQDTWQAGMMEGPRWDEVKFWMGDYWK